MSGVSTQNIALLVLNVAFDGDATARSRFEHLWRQSSLRLCADGAANRLHDSFDEVARASMLPDLIAGDLDSLRGDVADYYSRSGVLVEGDRDQDTHDFEKCLLWLQRHQSAEMEAGVPSEAIDAADSVARSPVGIRSGRRRGGKYTMVAFGAFGGRLDQQMANLNMAYTFDQCFDDFFLVSAHSLAFLLRPGTHHIERNRQIEDGTCGLIPLGGRCECVRTTGLQWNLDGDRPLAFGSLISSSNKVVGERVTVETSEPLLWTVGLRQRSDGPPEGP